MKCQFIKSDREQCRANSITGSNFCFTHDPRMEKRKLEAVKKGGSNRKHYQSYGDPIDLTGPTDVKILLSKVINGVWTGQIPAGQPANAIGFLSRCFLDAHEKGEIEARIETLEAKLELKSGFTS